MEVVVTTGAIKHAQLQSYHHQQTNTQLFTGWLSFLSPNQQRQSTYWSVRIEVGKQKQQICRSQCCLCTFVACRMVRRWLIHHIQENIQSASIWMKRWPLLCQSVCLSVSACLPANCLSWLRTCWDGLSGMFTKQADASCSPTNHEYSSTYTSSTYTHVYIFVQLSSQIDITKKPTPKFFLQAGCPSYRLYTVFEKVTTFNLR